MANAESNIRISELCRDARLKAIFEPAERDGLLPMPVHIDCPRILTGGPVREPVEA
jgi:hypothetical protein